MVVTLQDFTGQQKSLYGLGDAVSKLDIFVGMDLEPFFKVHNLVVQLNNTKLGQVDCSQSPIFPWDFKTQTLRLNGRHLCL